MTHKNKNLRNFSSNFLTYEVTPSSEFQIIGYSVCLYLFASHQPPSQAFDDDKDPFETAEYGLVTDIQNLFDIYVN